MIRRMSPRGTLAPVSVALLFGSWIRAEETALRFENNRFYRGQRAVLLRGTWQLPKGGAQCLKSYHLNTTMLGGRKRDEVVKEASAAGLYILPYLGVQRGRGKSEEYAPEYKAAAKGYQGNPQIVAWFLGDETNVTDLPRLKDAHQFYKQELKSSRPLVMDPHFYDTRLVPYVDVVGWYHYPLLRDDSFQEYADRITEWQQMADGRLLFTWLQCHPQNWYWYEHYPNEPKWGTRDKSFFPSADHVRLVTYYAMSRGVKGLLYFTGTALSDLQSSGDRLAEIGLMACEMDLLEQYLAEGEGYGTAKFECSQPVYAGYVPSAGAKLVFLVRQGSYYCWEPGRAEAEGGKLAVDVGDGETRWIAVGVDFPEVKSLESERRDGQLVVDVPPFELTAKVLLVSDPEALTRLKERARGLLPESARLALDVMNKSVQKAGLTWDRIEPFRWFVRTKLKRHARDRLAELEKERFAIQMVYREGRYADAFRAAREAQADLRAVKRLAWEAFYCDDQMKGTVGRRMHDFYALPTFLSYVDQMRKVPPTPNQIPNPSFEDATQTEDLSRFWHANLGILAELRNGSCELCITDKKARTGHRALGFVGQGKVTYQDMKFDWASCDIVADSIEAGLGDVIAFDVWVNMPETLEDTERGVSLRIKALDEKGKKTPMGTRPEVSRKDGTGDEWVKLRWIGRVTSPATRYIQPRVAFCGRGRAYVDDISVVLYRAAGGPP